MASQSVGLLLVAANGPGVLHQLTGVIARHGGDITSVEILESGPAEGRVYFELELAGDAEALRRELEAVRVVRQASLVETF